MSTVAFQKDIGAYVDVAEAVKGTALTTASADINGAGVERSNYLSAVVAVDLSVTTMKANATSSVIVKVQDADSSTGAWSDFVFADGSTSATLTIGNSTAAAAASAAKEFDVNLSGAKNYVRVVLAPDLDTTSTATVTGNTAAIFVFGGKAATP